MKYAVITFGCRVNQADSLELERALGAAGARPVPPESADLVVVNTCSVTSAADQAARQALRRLARDNPSARVVVTGCFATREPAEVARLPNVSRVVPNGEKAQFVLQVVSDLGPTTRERFGSGEGSCGAVLEPGLGGRTAYTLRVQTGCAEPCAYCIIPTTRGLPRSVALDEVLAEADRLVAAGFKEIVLTGVHLGSYGRDLSPSASLACLFEQLAGRDFSAAIGGRPPGPILFRVSSLEPMDCGPAVVDIIATSGRYAHHFHLPLQHASDRLLARMRRPYTIAQYAALVDGIRARLPGASIGCDLIVGFPGERDEDVDTLVAYLESSPLTHAHVFPYSDRPGTAAAVMDGHVPGHVVRERARRVREAAEHLRGRFRRSQVGATRPGLTLGDGSLVVTDNYLKVGIPPGCPRNEWVAVRITGITDAGEEMIGEVMPSTRRTPDRPIGSRLPG